MRKIREIDRLTKHVRGRVFLSNNGGVIFPSSETMFLRKLEEKILSEAKGFKYAGIKLEFFEIQIK